MGQALTAREIVSRVAIRGHAITVRQLESLRNLGVLLRGTQHGLGQAVGSAWLYPLETVDRLVAFLELRRPKETQPETAVRLWLRGYDFELEKLRRCFTKSLTRFFKLQRQAVQLGPVGFAEKLVDEIIRQPGLAKKYGLTVEDRHEYVQQLGEILGGIYSDPAAPIVSDAVPIIEKHIGASPQMTAILQAAFGTTLANELPFAMPMIASIESAIATSTDDELLAIRIMSKCVGDIRKSMKRLPPDFPTLEFLEKITENHDSSYGLAMLLLSLRRYEEVTPKQAITSMQSVAESTMAAADRLEGLQPVVQFN